MTRKTRSEARAAALSASASVLGILAGDSKRARPMDRVAGFRAVPTVLSSFNRATTVGGMPLSCVCLIHGPSMGGKSALLLALMRSFVEAGGLAAYVDAELAGDTKRWFPALGLDVGKALYVGRTDESENAGEMTYEEVVEEVDSLISRYQQAKRDGKIAPGTPLLIGVDSISKMVPANLLKNLEKDGGSALRGGVGRIQALLNTAWMAELGPKVGDDTISFCVIAHEMEAASDSKWTPDYKVRGGASLVYDSMLQLRVTYGGAVRDSADEGAPQVGKRHRVRVLKNKHGPAFQDATFYTASGAGVSPLGFDHVREVVHEALVRGVASGPKADKSPLTLGSRIDWGTHRRYTLKQLYQPQNAEIVAELAATLNAGIVES